MEKNIIDIIKNSGVVGAGGAGFPTHIKVNSKCKYVIVNAAECEPLLRVDQQLMEYKAEEILKALDLIIKHTNAEKGIIGIKAKHKNAVNVLKNEIKNYTNICVHELKNFYPAGDEQVLVYETIGQIIPEGGIPLHVGAVVLNSETLLNIYKAYFANNPVTEKYVTITGEVKSPITIKVPIGVTIGELIKAAGGSLIDDFVVVDGGPMMGKVVEDISTPITKTTKGLIVLPKNHPVIKSITKGIEITLKQAKTACMHCSLCSQVCPRGLLGHNIEPHKLIRIASYGQTLDYKSLVTTAFLCCECRLCEYACVMDLQPWKVNKTIKAELSKNNIRNPHNKSDLKADEFRQFKRYPVGKLIMRLGIDKYDVEAPLIDKEYNFSKVEILLKQHIGASTKPLVKVGEEVIKGQIIAQIPAEAMGANIYSSLNGIVDFVDDQKIIIKIA